MSGIGEAASIASLVAITGQSLNVLSKLFACVKAYQTAIPQAQKLAEELTLLQDCFIQIQHITSGTTNVVPELSYHIEALSHQVSRCQITMNTMTQKLQIVNTSKKRFHWKQIKVAATKDFFTQLQSQVASDKQDLILKLEAVNCALDFRATSELQRLTVSAAGIDRNIADMMQHLDVHSSASERQFAEMDAKIRKLQQFLELSSHSRPADDSSTWANKGRTRARRRVSQKAGRLELTGDRKMIQEKAPSIDFIRLVSPGILMREERGVTCTDLVGLEIRKCDGLSNAQKLNFICYLQGLRLLMWLLRRDNYSSTISTRNLSTVRSSLVVQAGITSQWEISNVYSGFVANLKAESYTSSCMIPWLRDRPWHDPFRRFPDRSKDWEEFMELLVEEWHIFSYLKTGYLTSASADFFYVFGCCTSSRNPATSNYDT